MAIYKSRNKWRAEFNHNGVRVKTRTFSRRGDAELWLADQRAAHGGSRTKVVTAATMDDACRRFVDVHIPTVRPATRRRYLVVIEKFIRPFFRYMRLDSITVVTLEDFQQHLAETLCPSSANKAMGILGAILKRAVRWGLVRSVPPMIQPHRIPQKDYEWWSQREDIERFLTVAGKNRYYPAYLLALECGLRFAEVIGLRVEDIDFQRGTLTVRRQWNEKEKAYAPTKSGRPRTVSFSPDGALAKALTKAAKESTAGRIIMTSRGTVPKRCVVVRTMAILQRRAGVTPISFHGLRHTFASWYMRTHDNLWALKELLGHTDSKTSMIYAHHGSGNRHQPLGLDLIPHKSHTLRVVNGGNAN